MGNIGWSGIIIIAVIVVLLFGRGKISSIMGDIAKGIKSFKKGMSDDTDRTNSSSSENKVNEDQDSENK
jgi:sec-independent protein translocase protein TatA